MRIENLARGGRLTESRLMKDPLGPFRQQLLSYIVL